MKNRKGSAISALACKHQVVLAAAIFASTAAFAQTHSDSHRAWEKCLHFVGDALAYVAQLHVLQPFVALVVAHNAQVVFLHLNVVRNLQGE